MRQLSPLVENINQQGFYSLSYYYLQNRSEYCSYANVTIYDCMVDDKYKEVANDWTHRIGKCFWVVEFDETKITALNLAKDFNDYPLCSVEILAKEDAARFLRDFTTCSEENGVFTLRDEITNPDGSITPAYIVNLN